MSDELERRLAATLDRSLDRLDGERHDEIVVRLAQARRRALQRRRAVLAGLAMAAGIGALLLVSNLPTSTETGLLPELAQRQLMDDDYVHLQVDPQLISDLEMLELIGEVPDAS